LIQALDVKHSQLLQIPHFGEVQVEKCSSAKPSVSTLVDFIAVGPEWRRDILGLQAQELADIEAFCAHVGEVQVKADIEVDDEDEFVVGDVATVTVQLVRKNLQDGEAMGAVHAPLFAEAKYEEWWFFLVEAEAEAATKSRLVHFERLCDVERCVEQQLRFQITKSGQSTLVLHAMCDSYAGLDQKLELTFGAKAEEDFKREFKVHHEDEELDFQPTLFQQFMGEYGHENESEEEEENNDGKTPLPSNSAASKVDEATKTFSQNSVRHDVEDDQRENEDDDTSRSSSNSE